ncbi:MAG: hypothetical protein DRQ56_04760 [Gammaproteobacteria bacterium]|nr:MAG: hypothetical protein DRQ56_04760 [Gammaproteobacteria bacterium]
MLESSQNIDGGFDIAVLTREKQAGPTQGGALPFCEKGIKDRLLIISSCDVKESFSDIEEVKRDGRKKIKRTINRKSITFDGTITHYGKTYQINNGRGEENLGLYSKILQRIIEQFGIGLMKWKRVFVLRFELHLAYETNNNKCITDFRRRLFPKLKRVYGFKEFGYCWAREYHGKGKGQHYHFVLFLDGNLIRHSSKINEIIRRAWQRPNGSFTIGKIERPFYFVNNEEVAQDAIYRVSYLAKIRGKGHRDDQVKDYQCSRMKPP